MHQLSAGSHATIDRKGIAELSRSFRGLLLRRGDPGYDQARRLWNAEYDRHPGLIARCTGAADVVAAIRFARDRGLLTSVKAGGHSMQGLSMCDGGLAIDLSSMKGVVVDPAKRTALVHAGATWSEFDHEAQAFGLATTGGVVSHTGVAGLTLGGGLGFLMRNFGLSIDNLLSVMIVTADGRLLRAADHDNDDLFWAVRGGGGNFGIVTSFEFRLHEVGPQVLGGNVLYSIDGAADALRFYREFGASAPDELTMVATLITVPADPQFPEELHGRQALSISAVHSGSLERAERDLRPLREFGRPAANFIGVKPYTELQSASDQVLAWGNRYHFGSGWMDELSDQVIDTALDAFADVTSPMSALDLGQLGGAVARVPEDATAFSDRDTRWSYYVAGVWRDAHDSERNQEWVKRAADRFDPFRRGGYINVQATIGHDDVRSIYGAKFERLVALKQKYDPTNLFRLNANIKPAA